jgi:hypothetical protein
MAQRARPGRPAAPRHELTLFRVRACVRVEILLSEATNLLEPRVVGAAGFRPSGMLELRLQQHPQRRVSIHAITHRGGDRVIRESRLALLAEQSTVLEQPQVARHPRLRDAKDARELGDVQALQGHQPQEPQPGLVAEQPVQGRGISHIYKSTSIDVDLASHEISRND